MSIAELTAATLPRHTGRSLQRRTKTAYIQTLKATRRRTKKLLRTLITWQRSQYYLATAVRDLRRAASRNEDIVLGSMIIALVVVFAFASTVAHVVLQSFLTMSYLNDVSGLSVLLLLCLFGGVLATLAAWLAAWLSNTLSLAVMDGATRKRNKSLRSTLRRGLRLASRTAGSWFLVGAAVVGPMLVVTMVSMAYVGIFFERTSTNLFAAMAFVCTICSLWLLYALTSFGLAPQVALFESNIPLLGTLRRSHSLVIRKGRPFLLTLYVSVAAFIAASYGVAMTLHTMFGTASDVIFYAGLLLAVLGANLMLTTLYRKRKLARS